MLFIRVRIVLMEESEKKHEENKIEKAEKKADGPSKITQMRYSHKFRIWAILFLMVVVAILFVFWTKARIALVIAFVALLAGLGFEVSQTDYDLGKMWETKSFQESKVSRDESGNILFDKFGNVTTDKSKGKQADDYNCADFSTQPEAQRFFLKVGGVGNDVNRLDGNKDGQACEALPKGDN